MTYNDSFQSNDNIAGFLRLLRRYPGDTLEPFMISGYYEVTHSLELSREAGTLTFARLQGSEARKRSG